MVFIIQYNDFYELPIYDWRHQQRFHSADSFDGLQLIYTIQSLGVPLKDRWKWQIGGRPETNWTRHFESVFSHNTVLCSLSLNVLMVAVNHSGWSFCCCGSGILWQAESLWILSHSLSALLRRDQSYVYPIAMTPHGASSIEPSVNVARWPHNTT